MRLAAVLRPDPPGELYFSADPLAVTNGRGGREGAEGGEMVGEGGLDLYISAWAREFLHAAIGGGAGGPEGGHRPPPNDGFGHLGGGAP